ncbi:MAG: hypothetical protein H7A32_06100 [Deltaproteobacteria bacterium]|nr:hypothetical protein [Deltaproteobacteria bacterium]
MKVGRQTGEDDYQKRFEAFVQKIEGKDSEYENKLITEVLKQDEGAADSWLSFSNIQQAIQNGEINVDQSKLIGEGFAAAYNQDSKYLDKYISPPQPADFDFNGKRWEADVNKRIQFLDWIKSSSGPESKKFQKNFPKNIKKSYLKSIEANPYQKIAATGFILHLNGANIFADSSIDSISNIFSASANSENEEGKELSVGLARVAAESPQLFEAVTQYGGNIDNNTDRVNALGELMTKQSGPILDELTRYDRDKAGIPSRPEWQKYNVNSKHQGTLYRLTAFNLNYEKRTQLQKKITNYAYDLKLRINQARGTKQNEYFEPAMRLALLSAGTDEAISQNYEFYDDNLKKNQELLSFSVDLAFEYGLKKIPIASSISSRVGGALKKFLSDSLFSESKFKHALAKIEEDNLYDKSTGKLTDDAKIQMSKSLENNSLNMLEQTLVQNLLREAFVEGIISSRDRKSIIDTADRISHER